MKSTGPLTCVRRGSFLLISVLLFSTTVGTTNCYSQCASCDGCDANLASCETCNGGRPVLSLESACRRWESIKCGLEQECGIEFEGALSQFYQGVASGGIEQEFRYSGHGDYELSFDFGRICDLDRWTLELGAEHRFAETVNLATGSIIPVAVAPSLPSPATDDLALTKVRFAFEVYDDVEVFFGKIDALEENSNAFADGNGSERFFGSSFNFYTIAVRTVPFSTLAAGVNVFRGDERAFTLAVLNTEDTATTVGIRDLFANGAVIFTELRLPVTVRGRRGHQAIGGSWSSATFTSLAQEGRINFPDVPIATKNGSWALFWSADQYLWQDPCDDQRGWGLFAEAGISDGNPNPIKWSLSCGVGGNSPLPQRVEDLFGIGWYYVGISDEFNALAGLIDDGQGVELFYDLAVSEALRVAINFQVIDPTFTGADTAVVPGVRCHVEF